MSDKNITSYLTNKKLVTNHFQEFGKLNIIGSERSEFFMKRKLKARLERIFDWQVVSPSHVTEWKIKMNDNLTSFLMM